VATSGGSGGGSSSTPKIQTLHIMQCSLQRTDSVPALEHDMKYAFSQEPVVIGFTEIVSSQYRSAFYRICRARQPACDHRGQGHLRRDRLLPA